MVQADVNHTSVYRFFVKVASVFSLGVGLMVLLGWLFDIATFKSVIPGLVNMKANTALTFVFSGISLWFLRSEYLTSQRRIIAQFCAGVVLFIGSVTLIEYLFTWNIGIDQLLFQDVTALETSNPGRMAPITALNYFFIGITLLLLDSKTPLRIRLTDLLCTSVILLSYLSLLGYVFSIQSFYYYQGFTALALHTAVTFIVLSLGILFARPHIGMMSVITGSLPGGKMWRRLLPAITLVPLLLGSIVERLGALHYLGVVPVSAVLAGSLTIIFAIIVWFNARSLNEAEKKVLYVNRLLSFLSDINQTIVRVEDIQIVFNKACTIAIEQGGFRMAWIGKKNNDTQKVDVIASAGFMQDYLEKINIDFADKERSGGPTGRAILTGVHAIADEIETDETMRPWKENALLYGYKSSAAFPIIVSGDVWGIINLYASETFFFNEQEVKLLNEMASDIAHAIDVSRKEEERERVEEMMVVSETRYRRLFEAARDGILILDAETGMIVDANPFLIEMLGFSHANFLGKTIWEVGSLKDVISNKDKFLELQKNKYIRYENLPLETVDGRRIEVEFVSNVYLVNDDKVIQCNIRDNTDRKKAEEALILFRNLVNQSNDAIELIDLESGRFLDVNEKGCLDIGYTREEFLALSVFDVDPLVTKSIFSDIGKEVRKSGVKMWEGIHRRKDGSTFPVEVNIKYVRLDREYLVTVARDITERKRVEDSLLKLKKAVDTTMDTVFMTDHEGVFTYVNPGFTTLYGYKAEEVIGKVTPRILKSGNLNVQDYDVLWETLLNKREYRRELSNKRKDGTLVNIETVVSPILDDHNTIIGFLAIQRDISERLQLEGKRKSLQSQLQQAQKLESLGTLASGIAHDFNNILSIMIGHASLLGQLPPDSQVIKNNTDTIVKAGMRGAALVKQLLTFARKSDILVESVRLNDVVVEISKLLGETFPKTVTVSLNLEKHLPSIVADATQMHQVLLNLCVNARDAMPDGGTLTISTYIQDGELIRTKFPNANGKEYVGLRVSDTGIGMDDGTRNRIFEPFFTTKEIGKGTGLGLSLVFAIMEGHNGYIDVRSEPGKGTTFEVYFPLPLQVIEMEEEKEISSKVISGGSETILLIEDEELLRGLVKIMLGSKGYNVITAEDGVDGVEKYIQHQEEIRLVVSDFGLPKRNGFEAFKRIKDINPSVKFIIASGFVEPETKIAMVRAGVNDVIQKPYSAENMLHSVRSILDLK